MTGKKIVIDTNIWVSYFLGDINKLTKAKFEFDLEIYSTNSLVEEIKDVLSRPKLKKYLKRNIEDCISIHKDLTIKYPQRGELVSVITDSPDLKDNFLFDLCYGSNSKILITGDKPLLKAKQIKGIKIISWKAFKNATNQ